MADDSHPADDMIKSIQGLFNGDSIKQSLRDAWDRLHGNQQPPQPSLHDQQAAAMTKKANDAAVQRANKEFVDADAAAKIRAKANAGLRK